MKQTSPRPLPPEARAGLGHLRHAWGRTIRKKIYISNMFIWKTRGNFSIKDFLAANGSEDEATLVEVPYFREALPVSKFGFVF